MWGELMMQLPAGVRRVAETGEGEIGIGRSISAVSATPLMLEDVEGLLLSLV